MCLPDSGSRLEALEGSGDVALAGESLDPEHARVAVDERDDVATTSVQQYVDCEHVWVHEIAKLCRSNRGSGNRGR